MRLLRSCGSGLPIIASRDLFDGPWGTERAPDPSAIYTFVERKQQGTNPGITVKDPRGREWHVKQPPHNDQGAEGPIEVTLSRVLSAVGYHQPPVYFLAVVDDRRRQGHARGAGRSLSLDREVDQAHRHLVVAAEPVRRACGRTRGCS